MSYADAGNEMHATGLGLSVFACPWIPSAIPIAIGLGLSLSNPGEMDRAAEEWKDAAKKFQKFSDDLKAKIQALPAEHWTSDDKDAFLLTHEQFNEEVDKANTIVDRVGTLLKVMAGIYFGLAVFALAIGTFLAALAVLVQSVIAIPFVNASVIATANSIGAALIGIVDPAIVSVQTFVMAGKVLLGLFVAALVGSYGGEALALGKGTPAFKDVTVNLPSGS